jgi:hypothetical protein
MVDHVEASRAVAFLIDSANEYATARANKSRAENMLRVIKSLAMKASGEKSASGQEREAYASEQYQAAVDDVFITTRESERLWALREGAKFKIELWRSVNSGLRAAERGFGSAQ